MEVALEAKNPEIPDTGLTLRQYYIMVGLGAFVTTIAQPGVIGRLPLQLLLKQELHFTAQTLAAFMLIATFAWNVKPVAGILSDADRKSTRLNSSHSQISYAVFCLKKKKNT